MSLAPIVDSHCHLDFPPLSEDLPGVLARAANSGVHLMVSVCTRVRRLEQILKIAEAHENVYCTVGTHPNNVLDETGVTVDELVDLSRHPKVVGIGESGLDYHHNRCPRDVQAESFRIHIAAARQTRLPLAVHSRSAEDDTAAILEDEMRLGSFSHVLHCFSSNVELARRALSIGAYISFSGILTFKSAEQIRQTAEIVPMDRLLVETDAPYLAPVPYRGKNNEPAFTRHTLNCLADVKGVGRDEMAHATSDNFFRLFSKAPMPAVFGK